MAVPDSDPKPGKFVSANLRDFLHDFAAFAGRDGITAAILVAFGAVLEGLSLLLLVPLLGIVIGSGLPSGQAAGAVHRLFSLFHVASPIGQLALLLAIFGVLMTLRAVVLARRDVAVVRLQTGFIEAQRLRIAESLAAAPWEHIARLRHARITQLMSGDIQRIGAAAFTLLRCIIALAMLLVQVLLVFLLAPLLAALAVGFLALAAVVLFPMVRSAGVFGAEVAGANLSLLDSTAQFLGGLKLAISQNLQTRFVAEFRRDLNELTARQVAFVRQHSSRRELFSVATALAGGLLVLLGFGVFAIAPPTLIALLLVVARMSGPAGQIQQSALQLAQTLPVYGQVKTLIRELAALPHAEPLAVGANVSALPEGPIALANVSFHYPGDEGAGRGVRDIDLILAPGECVGITGPSGAGKTTLADLLVGLFAPDQGAITVGGQLLDGATLTAWRDRVSYVAQDPFLFHDTIRRNLAWATHSAVKPASEADLWEALRVAGADQVVRDMARRLDTLAGERGTLMSGGERQRIALARAVLRKPRLLVLDEATGAIDIAAERGILARLRGLLPQPTIVIIAHRSESLALCDRVLRMEAGRIAGTAGE
jgi:ATP-binding cassette subfamily C protein